ncbi:MAG: trigger factor [Candidatus Dojkabacteria bacterium]|jgi:FKBP-type peptidyl-prolyl cis-trans isomerase (trigger factor)
MNDFYTRKDVDKSTIEFTITIPKDAFQKSYKALLEQELSNTKIDGFRKGKVPTDLVEPQVSTSIKTKVLEQLVPMYLTTALQKENINPIAPPDYKNFPDLSKDEDLELKVGITVMPEFKLGYLNKVKVTKEKVTVSKKEVDEALNNLFKNENLGEKEINDKWAKGMAEKIKIEGVKTLKELEEFVKKTIKEQKEIIAKRKAEEEAFNKAIELNKIEIPQPAIEYEAQEREHSFVHDMGHDQTKIDNFLKANNITMGKMRELWLKDAKEALETDVFLKLYAKEKNIKVTDEDLAKKIEGIKSKSPQVENQTIFENEEWKEYVRRVEVKEKAFREFIKEVLGE